METKIKFKISRLTVTAVFELLLLPLPAARRVVLLLLLLLLSVLLLSVLLLLPVLLLLLSVLLLLAVLLMLFRSVAALDLLGRPSGGGVPTGVCMFWNVLRTAMATVPVPSRNCWTSELVSPFTRYGGNINKQQRLCCLHLQSNKDSKNNMH
jgi:hypothetical protein